MHNAQSWCPVLLQEITTDWAQEKKLKLNLERERGKKEQSQTHKLMEVQSSVSFSIHL